MHHGTPQDMESDPDDEVNVTLHHHTELLLLFLVDFCVGLCCCCCCNPASVRVCVCGVKDASRLCGRCCCRRHCQRGSPLRMGGGGRGRCKSFKSAGGLFTRLSSSSQVQWSRLPPQLVFHHCLPSHDMLNRLITSTSYLLLKQFCTGLLSFLFSPMKPLCLLLFVSLVLLFPFVQSLDWPY